MLKKVTILPTEEYKRGLSTYANLFKLKEGQSPDCIDVHFNIDGSIGKRLGTTTMNSTALQGTGGWGMFDGGVRVAGLDTATKLLLHCNGAEGSTTFDDASTSEHVMTAGDGAKVDTIQYKFLSGSLHLFPYDTSTTLMLHCDSQGALTSIIDETGKVVGASGGATLTVSQKKFGNACLLLDGTNDYLRLADSTDWDLGTGNFTVDFWVRFNDLSAGTNPTMLGGAFKTDLAILYNVNAGTLEVHTETTALTFAWSPSTNTWYHVAVVRDGTDVMAFVDGTQIGTTKTSSVDIQTSAGIVIGWTTNTQSTYQLNGWVDEFRISKGVAHWVSNFTAPTLPNKPHLSTSDSDDWTFDADFTVDFWARLDSINNCVFLSHGNHLASLSDKSWAIQNSDSAIEFLHSESGSGAYVAISSTWVPVVDTWYHMALVRTGTTFKTFLDGTQIGSDSLLDGALYNSTDNLVIGANYGSADVVNMVSGWMDEVRISKGMARWTANFTAPAEEYLDEDVQARRLLCASGSGIYYSTDLGKNWLVAQTSRTQTMNHFSFIKSYFVNTNDDYQPPHYWAGSAGTYFAPVAPSSAPLCKYSLSYQGFAIMLNEKDSKRSFYYADENDLFTEDSWSNFALPTQRNDELTGGFVLRDKLYVSSKFKLYRISYIGGNPDWAYKEIKNWGFVPETFRKVEIPGVGEVVMGLDWEKNLRLFNGFEDEIVSTDLEKNNSETPFYMDNINDNNLKYAWGEDDKRERLYRLMMVYGASDRISKELVYNYRANAFYPNENRKFQFGISAQDTAGGLHMMACDYSGRIHHIDSGNTDAGTAIDEHYTSHFIYPQSPSQVHKAQKAYTYWDVDSTGMVYFEDRTDFSNVWNIRKCFELVSTLSAVQTSQAIDLPTIAKTYQYKVHSSASTANPWQLNRFDYVQTTLGVGKP